MITKKKRWIMQDCSNTTFTVPIMLMEMYEAQICEYGYRDRSEVLIYLAVGLWNKENGIVNSRIVRSILSRVTPERAPVFLRCPRRTLGIVLPNEEKEKILSLSRYEYLSNLMNAVLEAFLAAGRFEKRMLRKEMHALFVRENTCPYYLSTYVSDQQYDLLCRMIRRSGLSLTELLRTTIDVALSAENLIPETRLVPFEIQDAIQDYLRIEGFTLHRFQRNARIQINMDNDIHSEAICHLIHQYSIPGATEFLRRILLFLLNSKNIPDLRIPEDYPDDNENVYFDDNETYTNNRLSRKDFVRSIYQ